MKTLKEIKNKFPEDVDWNWGTYEVHNHTIGNNPRTYLLHQWDNNIWVYDVQNGLSCVQTYTNKTMGEVKDILGK